MNLQLVQNIVVRRPSPTGPKCPAARSAAASLPLSHETLGSPLGSTRPNVARSDPAVMPTSRAESARPPEGLASRARPPGLRLLLVLPREAAAVGRVPVSLPYGGTEGSERRGSPRQCHRSRENRCSPVREDFEGVQVAVQIVVDALAILQKEVPLRVRRDRPQPRLKWPGDLRRQRRGKTRRAMLRRVSVRSLHRSRADLLLLPAKSCPPARPLRPPRLPPSLPDSSPPEEAATPPLLPNRAMLARSLVRCILGQLEPL